jgi:hypothetical protein
MDTTEILCGTNQLEVRYIRGNNFLILCSLICSPAVPIKLDACLYLTGIHKICQTVVIIEGRGMY